ncbi:MAG: hypothetical protein OWU84_04355 [Firmicutes bacterium]|nr:hypothetical protein [Bacillota bacterium]
MRKNIWRHIGLMVAVAGLAVGCGTSASHPTTAAGTNPSRAKPSMIIPTPAATLDASAPEPNGTFWVLAGPPTTRGIYEIDVARRKVLGSVSVSNSAVAIAESSTGVVAVGLATPTTGAVEFCNGSTGALLNTVPVGGPVVSIAAGDDGTSFYVLNGTTTAKTVTIVDSQTDKIVGNIPAPADAVSVVPAPNETSVYVLEPNGVVSQIATTGGHILAQFPIGHSGRSLAIGPDGHTLYVLKGQGATRNVAVVNLATESVHTVLPAPANAEAIVLSPDGQILYDVVGTPTVGNVQAYTLS